MKYLHLFITFLPYKTKYNDLLHAYVAANALCSPHVGNSSKMLSAMSPIPLLIKMYSLRLLRTHYIYAHSKKLLTCIILQIPDEH